MDVNSANKWEADYRQGTDIWDLGGPNPVFQRLIAENRLPPGRMIALGAGRGYDAREFARRGFEVTAVDFSPSAVNEMHRLADPEAPLQILQHDLFSLPGNFKAAFDYVLEYVCYCAIDPQRREAFVDLVAWLLKPGGAYLSLAFPLAFSGPAPPYPVSVAKLLDMFAARDFRLVRRESPADSIRPRRGNEELLLLEKGG